MKSLGRPGSSGSHSPRFGTLPPVPGRLPGNVSKIRETAASGAAEIPAAPTPARVGATKALLLVDNVRLTRECLTHLLVTQLADFEVVSIAHSQQATDCGVWPDIVLLNVRATQFANGALLDDIAAISAATHRAPLLLLTESGDPIEASHATEAGAAGLFPSNCGVALLIAAINLVVAGGQFHAPTPAFARAGLGRNEANAAKRTTDPLARLDVGNGRNEGNGVKR